MSRINELIERLCPDGVEYKRFDEVCSLKARIGWQRLTKSEQQPAGNYMLVTGTDFTSTHHINYESCVYVSKDRFDQDRNIQLRDGDVLITKDGTLGKVAVVENLPMPATLNGGVFVVRDISGKLNNRFIMHYLLSGYFSRAIEQQSTGSTISHLTQKLFSRLVIPIPPMIVQLEIVRILDSFVQLEAELEAELEVRRQQYDYCRRSMLDFHADDTVRWIPLSEIGDLCMCKRIFKHQTSDSGDVPFYKIGTFGGAPDAFISLETFNEYVSKYSFPNRGDLLISCSGTIGRIVAYDGAPAYFQDSNIVWISNDERQVTNAFLKYWYSIAKWPITGGGTIGRLYGKDIKKMLIPVPSHETQARIVRRLDAFDTLVNDVEQGLPAEIEARRKQYAYYRDKLLTFREKRV